MEKIWQIKKRLFEDEIEQLLYNRGVIQRDHKKEDLRKFLEPDFESDFHDPKLLPNYQIFEDRLITAVDKKETVGIFADYDADGIPGAAFLQKALTKLGLKNYCYIPTREEGYGLSQKGVDTLIKKGANLIITIDLGIKSFEIAEYLTKKKYDLIITDHHLPDSELPNALAVINPKNPGSKYPFKELSGAGVIFKLIQGLSQKYPNKISSSFLKWNLDLIAISTISDVVPLIDENRIIAKYGLISLAKTRNIGLTKLYEISSIDQTKISSYSVGFQIAPRINAPGRVDSASKSYELLISQDESEVRSLASWLNEKNQDRQTSMEEVQLEAVKKITEQSLNKNKIIVVYGDWPKGVIGPTASRLVESYSRPVILLSKEGDYYSGSSRSFAGFNMVEALGKTEKYLENFGGHKGAAGLKLKSENLHKFIKKIIEIAELSIKDKDLTPTIEIDLRILANKMSIPLFDKIKTLEPFGLANPRPLFLLEEMQLEDYSFVGRDNRHLRMLFSQNKKKFEAIYFSCQKETEMFVHGRKYDLVFSPDVNRWNGQEKLSLNIIDLRQSINQK